MALSTVAVVLLLALTGLAGCFFGVLGTVSWPSWEGQTAYRLSSNLLTPYPENRPATAGRLVRGGADGLEVWQFETRVVVRALVGIPYGRMPQDILIVGSQQDCEAARNQIAVAGTPTEACNLAPWRFVPMAN
jgi:hypothetical protein